MINPDAFDDSTSVFEDSSVVVDVLVNDVDIDGDSLTVSIFSQPAFGVLTLRTTDLSIHQKLITVVQIHLDTQLLEEMVMLNVQVSNHLQKHWYL